MSTAPTLPRTEGLSSTGDGRIVPAARHRLTPLVSGMNPWHGWLATLLVTAIAAVMRLYRLGYPRKVLFDETYYAKDAWSLWHFGYTRTWVEDANDQMLAGTVPIESLTLDTPQMAVHPELGKWLIGAGQAVFGFDPFGWRIASAVAGIVMVLIVIRLVRRLTGSTWLGCAAGLLLAFDGLQFVMSRLALLDIFMATFVLAGVACLVTDRDWVRGRVARALETGQVPVIAVWRPWRLVAGVMFGCAVSSKWTALVALAVFGIWAFVQDARLRRLVRRETSWLASAVRDGVPAFVSLVGVAFVVYLASWSGWIANAHTFETHLSNTPYSSYWGDYTQTAPDGFVGHVTQGLRSLWHYHLAVWDFHTNGLTDATHVYQSHPLGWPLINRPVGVDAELGIQPGLQGCQAVAGSDCLRQIILLGTPLLWWAGAVALLYAVYAWVVRRDWRYGVPLLGFAASWLPWFGSTDRPIFSYYAVAMIPFAVIAIVLVMGEIINAANRRGQIWGVAVCGAFVMLVVANFAWFYPIYTDQLLTHSEWLQRIWFSRWV